MAYIRSGVLGKVTFARAWESTRQRSLGHPKDREPPAGVDYDMWLGPAPEAPYCSNRCGPQQWRNILDYSGGKFTDWGAHLLDTAQWANNTERTTPVEVDSAPPAIGRGE